MGSFPEENFETISETAEKISKPCYCREEEFSERSFCYVEGNERDANISECVSELNENVWYEIKPPRLFIKEFYPTITARQVYIARVKMEDKKIDAEDEDEEVVKEPPNIPMHKKKSAVRFLSRVQQNME